jgi:hypothetical protein
MEPLPEGITRDDIVYLYNDMSNFEIWDTVNSRYITYYNFFPEYYWPLGKPFVIDGYLYYHCTGSYRNRILKIDAETAEVIDVAVKSKSGLEKIDQVCPVYKSSSKEKESYFLVNGWHTEDEYNENISIVKVYDHNIEDFKSVEYTLDNVVFNGCIVAETTDNHDWFTNYLPMQSFGNDDLGIVDIKNNIAYNIKNIIEPTIDLVNELNCFFLPSPRFALLFSCDAANLDNEESYKHYLIPIEKNNYTSFDKSLSVAVYSQAYLDGDSGFSGTTGLGNCIEINDYLYVITTGDNTLIEKRLKTAPYTLLSRVDLPNADVGLRCAEDFYKNGYFWIPYFYDTSPGFNIHRCYRVDLDLDYTLLSE